MTYRQSFAFDPTPAQLSAAAKAILRGYGTVIGDQQAENIALVALVAARCAVEPTPAVGPKTFLGPWESPGVPPSYSTVVRRLYVRGYLGDDADPRDVAGASVLSGFWCKNETDRLGYNPVKVKAPAEFESLNISEINSYPTHIIDRRIDLLVQRGDL